MFTYRAPSANEHSDIGLRPANVRFRGKADIIQEKADIQKCPLVTQSGHPAHRVPRSLLDLCPIDLAMQRHKDCGSKYCASTSPRAATWKVYTMSDDPAWDGLDRRHFITAAIGASAAFAANTDPANAQGATASRG